MLSTLHALKDKMDSEKLQSDKREANQLKLKWAEEENFLVEERARKARIEDEERA